ncbi:geranylgeranyl pyrophosphate synthetase [Lophiostoma macrostomum CBS 122681]|uniref:geranylgeranyl diphosphate synthase n=1 Tax=Lophiostoma macrostomum CBS 122681 TaxID=1314788 RepID=A0A6A6SVG0_9PLEO|nr:geranylgeranyl pyrophosphate synthetase [Lophiostoma macrostomum CBS 122681]
MPSLWEPSSQQVLHRPDRTFLIQVVKPISKVQRRYEPPDVPPINGTVNTLPTPAHTNGTSLSVEPLEPQTSHYETIVRLPFDYVAASPSKGIREKLIQAFNAWFAVPPTTLNHITTAIGILHTASLLSDDIQDNSPLRRGIPAAHTIYGTPQTINSANYMYFAALKELQSCSNRQVLSIFTEELLQLHIGQGMDLYWRDMLQCPTQAEYFDMANRKTGSLFRLAVRLMQAESTKPVVEGFLSLVESLSILFQIRDDYQNLVSSEYHDRKGSCEDPTEGKFSYPVIHSILSDQANPRLLQILKLRSTSDAVKKMALDHMESTGSLKHTRDLILIQISRARVLIDDVGTATEGVLETKGLHSVLDRLADGL